MAYQWKGFDDWDEHKRKCRESAAVRCSDNIYEQMRVRIVRVVREVEIASNSRRKNWAFPKTPSVNTCGSFRSSTYRPTEKE